MSIQTSEIKLNTVNAYLASPTGGGPGVLVLPAWWGLNPFFRQVCDQLAERGYTALAPDYYNGQVGTTIEEAQSLQEKAEGDFNAMAALIQAAKDHLVSLRPGEPIAQVAFSMGTDWAIMTAANQPDVAATVLFYGSYTIDFSRMKSKVLGHYAETDEWQPLERVRDMEQSMKAAGVDVAIHIYPETAHWFMEENRPEYDAAAASLAWERTFVFLQQTLG